ncbi:MAG: heavy-metal-associated domain-containing protein, partial [Nanoarchaeota archaeon]
SVPVHLQHGKQIRRHTRERIEDTMKTANISIPSMHCKACETLLTEIAMEIDGVKEATVPLLTKTATVTYDEKKTSESAIRKAFEDEGYPTR